VRRREGERRPRGAPPAAQPAPHTLSLAPPRAVGRARISRARPPGRPSPGSPRRRGVMAPAPHPPAPAALHVPVAGSDEAVVLPLASLPDDAQDVLDVLRAEGAPLALWRDVARAYLARV